MTSRRIWLVVLVTLAVVALAAVVLIESPWACGTDQTWTPRRGCWPRPAAS